MGHYDDELNEHYDALDQKEGTMNEGRQDNLMEQIRAIDPYDLKEFDKLVWFMANREKICRNYKLIDLLGE